MVWVAILVVLWVYWFDLPKYVSWPLAIIETAIADPLMFKFAFFSRRNYEAWWQSRAEPEPLFRRDR
jgi:hypothetical protein